MCYSNRRVLLTEGQMIGSHIIKEHTSYLRRSRTMLYPETGLRTAPIDDTIEWSAFEMVREALSPPAAAIYRDGALLPPPPPPTAA